MTGQHDTRAWAGGSSVGGPRRLVFALLLAVGCCLALAGAAPSAFARTAAAQSSGSPRAAWHSAAAQSPAANAVVPAPAALAVTAAPAALAVAAELRPASGPAAGVTAATVAGAAVGDLTLSAGPQAGLRSHASPSGGTSFTVGLFPWVPRPQQVEEVIAAAWRLRHPDVPLRFVFWDCYSSDPPPRLDVFVFDAVYLDRFVERGLVQPLAEAEIENAADLLPYAVRGARAARATASTGATGAEGATAARGERERGGATDTAGTLYGIPQYGCASLLFYRRGDRALEAAATLSDVVRALGTRTYSGLKPPRGTGLLVDLSDPVSDGCRYLEALEDTYGVYTADPPLAPTVEKLDPWAVDDVRRLLHMASRREADYASSDQFRRAQWFGRGRGRALIDYSEGLCSMGRVAQDDVQFKLMPFSDRGNVPLFYVDLVGLSPAVGTGARRALALELANLMASTEVMVKALGPWKDDPSPQYLFSVRRSVYDELAPRYPLYARLYQLIGGDDSASYGAEPQPFRVGAAARHWFDTMGPVIKRQVFAAPGVSP